VTLVGDLFRRGVAEVAEGLPADGGVAFEEPDNDDPHPQPLSRSFVTGEGSRTVDLGTRSFSCHACA
jgi:hypothetical protein